MYAGASARSLLSTTVLIGLAVSAACSSDSAPPPPPEVRVDLTGTWEIEEVVVEASGTCASRIGNKSTYTLTAVQVGQDLTVTTPNGTFTGTVIGTQVAWAGSWLLDGGTLTIITMALVASATKLDGEYEWSWAKASETCRGLTRVSGTKTSQTTPLPAFLPEGRPILLLLHDPDEHATSIAPGRLVEPELR